MVSITKTIPTAFSTLQSLTSSIQKKGSFFLEELRDRLHFLIEFIKDPFTNGSIVPSSIHLTRKIVQFIPKKSSADQERCNYLEVGAGPRPFALWVVNYLKPNDHLDIVELNPSYCEVLKKKFINHSNVHIHCLSITDWDPNYQYDAVISGLPLNGFSPELVEKCLDVFKKVTKNNGTLSYFDYPTPPKIWTKILFGEKKRQLVKVLEIKERFFQTYGFKIETEKKNFPTANIFHFRINKSNHDHNATSAI